MKKVLFAAIAMVSMLAFAPAASAQSIDLTGSGGLTFGEGEFELESVGSANGSTNGTGNVLERTSLADTASQNIAELRIDTNENRTNISFDGTSYAGAAAHNMIKTNGVHAGTTSSQSGTNVNGTIGFSGSAITIVGTGSASF